jgi:protein O-GlcNAc transferase
MGAFDRFHKRLDVAFSQYGLKVDDYCTFHPNLSQNQFLGLLRFSDIFLDSIEWQGFNSTMEALASDLPLVSLPVQTCRGRHTFAILKMIDLPDVVAKDLDDYIELAAKMGNDTAFREGIVSKIRERKMRAFNDRSVIKGLEKFLISRFEVKEDEKANG